MKRFLTIAALACVICAGCGKDEPNQDPNPNPEPEQPKTSVMP